MPDNMPRSAAMAQLLKSLGESVSGFLITPPGFDAPIGMVNITPLPGDFDLHGAFADPMDAALAAAAEEKGEAPPMMEPPPDEMVIAELDADEPDDEDMDDDEDDLDDGFDDGDEDDLEDEDDEEFDD